MKLPKVETSQGIIAYAKAILVGRFLEDFDFTENYKATSLSVFRPMGVKKRSRFVENQKLCEEG